MPADPANQSNRLVIPHKDKPAHPANLQTIERWANNKITNQIVAGTGVTIDTQSLSDSPGSTGTGIVTINASGGAGQLPIYTDATGLIQLTETGTSGGIQLHDLGGSGLDLQSGGTIEIFAEEGIQLVDGGGGIFLHEEGSGGITLTDDNSDDITFNSGGTTVSINFDSILNIAGELQILAADTLEVSGANGTFICANGSLILGFFNVVSGATQQTVTGSRGGNAALASLLTALASYGLIIDDSTP